jgi:predicted HTH transcriptional regulator
MSNHNMNLTEDMVREMIRQGENERVEFKAAIRDVATLSKNISALANAHGGILLIGIHEPNIIVGADPTQVHQLVKQSKEFLTPSIELEVETLVIDQKPIVAISVPETRQVVFSAGMALKRVGNQVRPLSPGDISHKLTAALDENEIYRIAEAIAKQTETIEKLRNELRYANSISSKLKDYVIGGIIGAILGAIATAII